MGSKKFWNMSEKNIEKHYLENLNIMEYGDNHNYGSAEIHPSSQTIQYILLLMSFWKNLSFIGVQDTLWNNFVIVVLKKRKRLKRFADHMGLINDVQIIHKVINLLFIKNLLRFHCLLCMKLPKLCLLQSLHYRLTND